MALLLQLQLGCWLGRWRGSCAPKASTSATITTTEQNTSCPAYRPPSPNLPPLPDVHGLHKHGLHSITQPLCLPPTFCVCVCVCAGSQPGPAGVWLRGIQPGYKDIRAAAGRLRWVLLKSIQAGR